MSNEHEWLLSDGLQQGPVKLRDSIRFRIVRLIRDSIRIDGPIRNFRIVRTVNRHSYVKKRLVVVKFALKVDFGS